jgi:hypothetical protein
MDESGKDSILQALATEYRARVLRSGAWSESELRHILEATEDLATLMGGPATFRRELRWVLISRVPWRTSMAAMAVTLLDVVYFESASWGDPPELKWQTVHELAHVWDMRKLLRFSGGLKRATGSRYGRLRRQLPVPFEYHAEGDWLKGRKPPLNALEDWADSVATYVYPDYAESARGGPRLISPVRWEYVSDQMEVRLPYPPEWIARF